MYQLLWSCCLSIATLDFCKVFWCTCCTVQIPATSARLCRPAGWVVDEQPGAAGEPRLRLGTVQCRYSSKMHTFTWREHSLFLCKRQVPGAGDGEERNARAGMRCRPRCLTCNPSVAIWTIQEPQKLSHKPANVPQRPNVQLSSIARPFGNLSDCKQVSDTTTATDSVLRGKPSNLAHWFLGRWFPYKLLDGCIL